MLELPENKLDKFSLRIIICKLHVMFVKIVTELCRLITDDGKCNSMKDAFKKLSSSCDNVPGNKVKYDNSRVIFNLLYSSK